MKKTSLHTSAVILGVAVVGVLFHSTFTSRISETDAQFERSFFSLYGFSSDDFYGLGEDGFVGRWLSDSEVEKRDCLTYDSCNFIEIATVTSCSLGFSLEFDLFDDNDKLVGHGQSDSSPLDAGELKVVELGANDTKPFAFLLPQEVKCLEEGVVV
jgi:hypothetical protein